MPTLPPLVIRILSDQLLPFHAENTMSLVDEPPGCAIPNDTAAVGSPPAPVWSFQNSISPLPPTNVSGDFVPVAIISTMWLFDELVAGCPPNVATLTPPESVSTIDESPSVPELSVHLAMCPCVPVPDVSMCSCPPEALAPDLDCRF